MNDLKEQQELLEKWKKSPLLFVKDVWGLSPQKPKPEYEDVWNYAKSLRGKEWEAVKKNVKAEWFGDYDAENFRYNWYSFEKNKNITWQQELLLLSMEKAVNRHAPNKISVVSGRGTGKTTSASWIILWFLFCYYDALIPCAAPTAPQLNDALWKELSVQIGRMPDGIKSQYEWISDHVRIKARPASWYARARTASKESPEALAGLHSDNMLVVVDESSAVDDAIFNTAEGSLTSDNAFVLLLSNPTRPTGYFFRTFSNPNWQNLQLSSIESPVVSPEYEKEKAHSTGGRDSENYAIDVLGKFPTEDTMNNDGYIRLFSNTNIQWIPKTEDLKFGNDSVVGIDPSGEGCFDDKTEILTENGFVYFKDLIGTEKILSLNPDNCLASWENINKVHKYDYDGYLNYYENFRGVNFAITDNHNLLVRSRIKKDKLKIKKLNDLPNDINIKLASGWKGQDFGSIKFEGKQQPNGGIYKKWEISSELWAEFLGWFVSEGSVYIDKRGNYNISIGQRNIDNRKKITNLLRSMGIGAKQGRNDIVFSNDSIGKHLLKECGKYAVNKKIPKYVKEATPELIRIFLNSFIEGDGTRRKDGGAAYYSSSKKLIDDLQECLVKIGLAGKITKKCLAGSKFIIEGRTVIRKNDTYVLWEKARQQDGYIYKSKIKRKPYIGYIYCVTTEKYKTILVRRNGVVMWSGNSDLTAIFIRDNFKGKMLFKESISNSKSIAERIITIIEHYKLNPRNVVIDNFGIGANVAQEVARASHGKYIITAVNVGESCDYEDEKEQYINKRALIYHGKLMKWLRDGGQLVADIDIEQEVDTIYFKRNLSGKVQIMPKLEMRKRGYRSPNALDAISLSFIRDIPRSNGYERIVTRDEEEMEDRPAQYSRHYDPFEGSIL